MSRQHFYVGVDVGTGSVRAAVFDRRGIRLGLGIHPLQRWSPQTDFHEQSSDDVWTATGLAVRAALAEASISAADVGGIAFDATCSLVALDPTDRPITVSPTQVPAQNVIMWLDHRATAQAARINATSHPALRFVGGQISPEMQAPKLLWIKEHLPDTWKRAARFLDLADFMSYRAIGRDVRSLCTTTCKWNYRPLEGAWDDDFLKLIGMGDLVDERHTRIGTRVLPQGERAGELTPVSAQELGLAAGTPVAVSMIDAHAGGLGALGMQLGELPLDRRLALICGSSTCHMAVAPTERFVPGVWGPYYSAMIPELWLAEGGQSATGTLLDRIVYGHACGPQLRAQEKSENRSAYQILNERIADLARNVPFPAQLTRDVHVYPDFHGNRSPLADPSLKGMVCGLTLDVSLDALAIEYLATVQAIAQGTRQIIRTLNEHGYAIDTLIACGGGTKNELFLQEHADVTGCTIVLPEEPEAVLLGAAILAAVACGDQPSIAAAMATMSRMGRVVKPNTGGVRRYHDAKERIHRLMLDHQRTYSELMRG